MVLRQGGKLWKDLWNNRHHPRWPHESLSLRTQSKCGKIRARKNSVFQHFLRSERIVSIDIYQHRNQHVKRGFSLLKARWCCLLERLDHEIENISKEITACFILHNICQMSRDECVDNDGLLENIIQQEKEARLRRRQNHMAILRLTTS